MRNNTLFWLALMMSVLGMCIGSDPMIIIGVLSLAIDFSADRIIASIQGGSK